MVSFFIGIAIAIIYFILVIAGVASAFKIAGAANAYS